MLIWLVQCDELEEGWVLEQDKCGVKHHVTR